jgi:hypothetical protein
MSTTNEKQLRVHENGNQPRNRNDDPQHYQRPVKKPVPRQLPIGRNFAAPARFSSSRHSIFRLHTIEEMAVK